MPTGPAHRDQQEPAPPTDRSQRLWRLGAWLAVSVAVVGHVWVMGSSFAAGTPSFNFDEVASLMPSRAILGLPTPEVGGSGYFPLPAVLAAPIWWFTSDPVTFYRAALVLSVAVGLLALWPLTRIATRFGLTTAQAATVAGIVMAVPARTVQAEYVLAEKPLMLILALVVLAVLRLTERPTYARAVLVSFLVALSYFTHARMPTLIVATAVWFLLFAVRRLWIGAVGLVSLAAFSWLAHWGALRIIELVTHFRQGQDFGSLHPGLLARTVLGQAWSQVVSTFGLAPLGLLVIVLLVVAEARRRSVGPALFVLLAVGAMFAGSAIDWAQPRWLYADADPRLDVWIYGRYVDPLFAFVLLAALAAVVRGVQRRQAWTSAALGLVIVLATVLWLAPQAPTDGFLTPAHAPGAAAFAWALPHTRFWVIASVVAMVPPALLLVARVRPVVVLAVVLVLGAAGTATVNVASGDFHDLRAESQPIRDTVVRIVREHPGTSISYFSECPGQGHQGRGRSNRYAWAVLPTVLGTDPGADLVIACPTHPAAAQPGAIALPGTTDGLYRVWVRPGRLQDELRSEGLLS